MWPYWLIFIVFTCLGTVSIRAIQNQDQPNMRWGQAWWFAFVYLTLVIGLRCEVGGDWYNYIRIFETIAEQTLSEALVRGEPSYVWLNWFASHVWGGVYLVNTVSALLFSWGLVAFCKIQARPWLALVVAVPYLVVVVAMGYTRQGVAIGLIMLGLVALHKGRTLHFLLWVAFASTFHLSAAILVPLFLFSKSRNFWVTACGGLISGFFLYFLLLKESLNQYFENYIDVEFASSGAAIRIAMNAFPAILFLCFNRRFIYLTPGQRRFWIWMSLGALIFVFLLQVFSSSSTALDRVALYWIPLQLTVWSQVPDAFGKPLQRNAGWVYAVIIYSAMVLFVWLVFATHSFYWLPYKFYPWEMLWQ